jgi:hypothetical protein
MRSHRYVKTLLSCCLLLVTTLSFAEMTDKTTGISFASKVRDLDLFGVGVRKKGPIKVYSVGMYCSDVLRESLSTISRTADKGKEALSALCNGAEENPTSFVL